MYKLVIEYTNDDYITDSVRSAYTCSISAMLVEYEAYGCCLDSRTIVFDDDKQRTIAMLVIGDEPNISRLKLG